MSNVVGNTWHSDLWRLVFSDVPGVKTADLEYLERYVKSISLPEYGLEFDTIEFQGYSKLLPIAHKVNTGLGLVQVEFKLSEYLKNYSILFDWIQQFRYAEQIDPLVRKYVCKALNVLVLDNEKRTLGTFSFTNAICTSISALPFAYGTGEEVSFTANFAFEEFLFEYKDIVDQVTG